MAVPKEGESVSYARTFTVEDVHAFADVSLDRGVHHVKADQEGRLLVHGLLTATIPTKLGGDLDYLAQEMTYRFHRPVFTGDEILCECRASRVEERLDRTYVEFEIRCTNQHGKGVLTGSTKGVILKS
ncbi:MAG TPA: MaoC family dehydratase N-terminal domain-containing protein [Candidatus Dormibacteraeota bacterium]